MDFGNIFTILLIQPITNLLIGIYSVFQNLNIPFPLGFSIIALTIIVKLALYRTTSAQIKFSKQMAEMAPHLSAMKEKHKGDQKRQNEEMMKLYKEFGFNPAMGCLPLLIQLPIFISLYNVLYGIVSNNSMEKIGELNKLLYFDWMKLDKLLDPNFFGVSLLVIPSKVIGQMPLLILLPVVTGILQLGLSKMMSPEKPPKTTKEDDFQTTLQKQSLMIIPIMVAYFSFILPIGLSIYWNVFSVFGIIQQYYQAGPGGLTQWTKKLKQKNGKNK